MTTPPTKPSPTDVLSESTLQALGASSRARSATANDTVIDEDELLLDRFHAHWHSLLVIVPAVLLVVALEVAAYVYAGAMTDPATVTVRVGIALFALAFSGALVARWATTVYRLTDRRLIRTAGILRRDFMEVPLTEIASVSVSQSLWERILRYGDATIETAGDSDQVLTDIPRPRQFKRQLSRARDRAGRRDQPAPGATGPRCAMEALTSLAGHADTPPPVDAAEARSRAWQLVARLGQLVEADVLPQGVFDRAVDELTRDHQGR